MILHQLNARIIFGNVFVCDGGREKVTYPWDGDNEEGRKVRLRQVVTNPPL